LFFNWFEEDLPLLLAENKGQKFDTSFGTLMLFISCTWLTDSYNLIFVTGF